MRNKSSLDWIELKFALKTVGLNGEISMRSNIASVVIKEKIEKMSIASGSTRLCSRSYFQIFATNSFKTVSPFTFLLILLYVNSYA